MTAALGSGSCAFWRIQSLLYRIQCIVCVRSLVGDEAYLMTLIATRGPVAVSVDATNWSNYQGGIIQYHCGETGNNHAVQIVGYDRSGV